MRRPLPTFAVANHRQPLAFTLIELLVVVAIIAVLMAILLPSLSHAKENAKQVQCMANIRAIGYAGTLYAQDYGQYPQNSAGLHFGAPFFLRQWVFDGLQTYGANDKFWICPDNPVFSKDIAADPPGNASWLERTITSYMWVAEGHDLTGTGVNGYDNFTASIPGNTYTDSASFNEKSYVDVTTNMPNNKTNNPSDNVMIADMMAMPAGPPYYWSGANHLRAFVTADNPSSPIFTQLDSQMTLFGDLHAEREKPGGNRLPSTLIGNGPQDNSKFIYVWDRDPYWKQPCWY